MSDASAGPFRVLLLIMLLVPPLVVLLVTLPDAASAMLHAPQSQRR